MTKQAKPASKYNIPDRIYREIIAAAKKHNINQVILFGSRARGDHTERSDIDLACSGGNFDSFHTDICEYSHTLLSFDIVNLDHLVSGELKTIIHMEGLIIYEKT